MKKFLKTILKIIIFFTGWSVCCALGTIPSENPSVWRFGAELLPLLWMILFTFIFWLVEKKNVSIPIINNCGRGSLIGFAAGIGWIGVTAILLLALQAEKITGSNQINYIWLWMLSAFLNTIMQELLVRGYIYQLIKKEYHMAAAMAATTALFTLLHGGAFEAGILPVLNVMTMSLFATAIYEYSGTLTAPVMAHAVWNIIGGIILGGVSLADDYPKLFIMEAAGNPVISGGDYMLEGSIVVLFLNISLFIFFWKKLGERTGKKS